MYNETFVKWSPWVGMYSELAAIQRWPDYTVYFQPLWDIIRWLF